MLKSLGKTIRPRVGFCLPAKSRSRVVFPAPFFPTRAILSLIGIARAWQHIGQADAVLLLHDATRQADAAHAAEDARIAARIAADAPASPLIHIWNKADALPPQETPALPPDALLISARTGQGLDALRQRLLRTAGWQTTAGESPIIARERHLAALRRTEQCLQAAHNWLHASPSLFLR